MSKPILFIAAFATVTVVIVFLVIHQERIADHGQLSAKTGNASAPPGGTNAGIAVVLPLIILYVVLIPEDLMPVQPMPIAVMSGLVAATISDRNDSLNKKGPGKGHRLWSFPGDYSDCQGSVFF
jgi:hypothetical protein